MKSLSQNRSVFAETLNLVPPLAEAHEYAHLFQNNHALAKAPNHFTDNPLWNYFQQHNSGPGIWKWEHYFDVYHRHLSKYIGRKVTILEIGIFSGGSLPMWRSYFGNDCHIHGVDIEEACRAYESDRVSVHIGDQADRNFWKAFREKVPHIDIVIDDGGHTPLQQQVTLEEMLPHVAPGGVFICEDVHESFNKFAAFATGLVQELNAINKEPGQLLQSGVSSFQSAVHSIHFYPYIMAIEKHAQAPMHFSAPRHGTEWQPFL